MNFQLCFSLLLWFMCACVCMPSKQSVRSLYDTVVGLRCHYRLPTDHICIGVQCRQMSLLIKVSRTAILTAQQTNRIESIKMSVNVYANVVFFGTLSNFMPINRFRSMLSRLVSHSRKFIASLQT